MTGGHRRRIDEGATMILKATLALAILALGNSWPASAGDERKEITPFIGHRFGGDSRTTPRA
jgi:hypothetical protein